MDVTTTFQCLGISLGLGLLVGMQRERVNAPLAGVRTFVLITLFGTLTGMLALRLGPWVVGAGILGVAIATAMGNILYLKKSRTDSGITTEIAILLMYAIGVYLVFGPHQVAVVLGGGVAVLLHAKPILHGFVQRLGEGDMRAIMQFVLISLVILPVLPDQPYGPFQVFNPREIWWMVVLVVGISLCGYVALKLSGERAGIVLAGLIGGLISSTATTVSVARRASRAEGQIAAATLAVMLASTVVYGRVLVEIFAVTPRAFLEVAAPVMVMLVVSILLCVGLWLRARKHRLEAPSYGNPTQLKSAIVFAALYAFVLLAVAAARHSFGNQGIFVVAAISGLTDMDAITLSAARMTAGNAVPTRVAWQAIIIAAMANLVFKAGIIAALGNLPLARRVALLFAIEVGAGLALLALWPG